MGRPKEYIVSESQTSQHRVAVADKTAYELAPALCRAKAKELYIVFGWEKEQLLNIGIPEDVLDTWLYRPTELGFSWSQERNIWKESILRDLKNAKGKETTEVLSHGFSVLKKNLALLNSSNVVLSVADMQKISSIIKDLDNIVRLEDGTPTEINKLVALTQADVRKMISELQSADPYAVYDMESIEVK